MDLNDSDDLLVTSGTELDDIYTSEDNLLITPCKQTPKPVKNKSKECSNVDSDNISTRIILNVKKLHENQNKIIDFREINKNWKRYIETNNNTNSGSTRNVVLRHVNIDNNNKHFNSSSSDTLSNS